MGFLILELYYCPFMFVGICTPHFLLPILCTHVWTRLYSLQGSIGDWKYSCCNTSCMDEALQFTGEYWGLEVFVLQYFPLVKDMKAIAL